MILWDKPGRVRIAYHSPRPIADVVVKSASVPYRFAKLHFRGIFGTRKGTRCVPYQAYCTYRDTGHKLVLQGERAVVNEAEVVEMSNQVEQIWREFME